MFGYNDAYKRLHSFLRRWQAAKPPPCKSLPPQHQSSAAPLGSPLTQQTNVHVSVESTEVATAANCGTEQWSGRLAGESFEEGANNIDEGRGSNTAACTAPYIVSVDVSRAFDNIDAGMLLGIVEPLLRSPEYLIIKYSEVWPLSASSSALRPLSKAASCPIERVKKTIKLDKHSTCVCAEHCGVQHRCVHHIQSHSSTENAGDTPRHSLTLAHHPKSKDAFLIVRHPRK